MAITLTSAKTALGTLDETMLVTVLGAVVVAVGFGVLLQNPGVRKACRDVLDDPEVQETCREVTARLGLAIADSLLRPGGVADLGPSI